MKLTTKGLVAREGIESIKKRSFNNLQSRQMTRKSPESTLNRVNSTQTARARKPRQRHCRAVSAQNSESFSPGFSMKWPRTLRNQINSEWLDCRGERRYEGEVPSSQATSLALPMRSPGNNS